MSQVVIQRTHTSSPAVCLSHRVIELLVDNFKALLTLLFMSEDLYDPLSVDHLLDKPVDVCKVLLLGSIVFTAFRPDTCCCKECNCNEDKDNKREYEAVCEHRDKDHHKCNTCSQKLHEAVRDKLVDGICIVGETAHDCASRILVEIGKRKTLEFIEHLCSHLVYGPLRNSDHNP